MKKNENSVILYQDEDGITRVSVRFENDDLWLTQNQIAEIDDTTQQNVSQHIDGIFKDGELDAAATHKKFLLVQAEGKRQVKREVGHYNLDIIIAIGYRVQSQVATRFRRWATERLHEYIQKGFTLDDERLEQGGSRYFTDWEYDDNVKRQVAQIPITVSRDRAYQNAMRNADKQEARTECDRVFQAVCLA